MCQIYTNTVLHLFHSLQFHLPKRCPHGDADGPLCRAEGSVLNVPEGLWVLHTNHSQHEGVVEGCDTDRHQQEVRKDTSCELTAKNWDFSDGTLQNQAGGDMWLHHYFPQAFLQTPLPSSPAQLQWWRSRQSIVSIQMHWMRWKGFENIMWCYLMWAKSFRSAH